MSVAWQMMIVATLVLWAAGNLVLRIRRLVVSPSSNACTGGCHGCPSDRKDSGGTLVQLTVPMRK